LFPTLLLLCGKANFTNLSRYSGLSEKSFRRQYSQAFNFTRLNAQMIAATPTNGTRIAAMDNSFIPKSGKKTHGLDWFYNGSASRSQKGLEISTIAVIDVKVRQAYTLSVQQTPANLARDKTPRSSQPQSPSQTIAQDAIERAQVQLQQLPEHPAAARITRLMIDQAQVQLQQLPEHPALEGQLDTEPTRIDHSITHLQQTVPDFSEDLDYLVVDAGFSKQKFVDAVVTLKLHLIGKLRHDANLKYLYRGEQKPRGAKRKYDGKVDFQDLSRFTQVQALEPYLTLYTAVVWHVSLKRQIRIVYLVDIRKPGKPRTALLFSTDLTLDAQRILEFYRARFAIEFIYREAKQFTGLCDAQTRDAQRLDFHFNASLTALNLARFEAYSHQGQSDDENKPVPFSMTSYKRIAFNDHLLSKFISMLELDSTLIKSHPNYETLRSYGIIAS
jgi:Transposase DDE domain/DDE superfamily endonuclease